MLCKKLVLNFMYASNFFTLKTAIMKLLQQECLP